MEDFIKAMHIFNKYAEGLKYPFHCEHDCMYVNINPNNVSDEDKSSLKELGFLDNGDTFSSYRYGSC